jgi:hypothetical protein
MIVSVVQHESLHEGPPPLQGCQIFLGTKYQNKKNIPNDYKIYQIATKIPNVSKIDETNITYTNTYQLQEPTQFTQIRIFGSKINHLATPLPSTSL